MSDSLSPQPSPVPAPASSPDPWSGWTGQFDNLPSPAKAYVSAAAQAAGVPLGIAAGHVYNESRGNIFDTPNGDNGAAWGPLQMHADALDDYNKRHGTNHTVEDLRDPWTGTVVGLKHLRDLYDQTGSWPSASMAYAAGPTGAVNAAKKYLRADGTIDFDKINSDPTDGLPQVLRNIYRDRLNNQALGAVPPGGPGITARYPGSYQTADLSGQTPQPDAVAAAQARAAAAPVLQQSQSQAPANPLDDALNRYGNTKVLQALRMLNGAPDAAGQPQGTSAPQGMPAPGGYSVPPPGQMAPGSTPARPAGLPAAPMGGAGIPAPPIGASSGLPMLGHVQPTPVPPMPANFAQNNQAPIPVPQNPYLAEHAGDAGLAMMLGGMSGKTLTNNPMVQAQQGLLNAGKYLVDAGGRQADLTGQTNQFNALADQRAAQTAYQRALAWKALQDGNIQPKDAAEINAANDRANLAAQAQIQAEAQRAMHVTGTPQLFVLPGQNPGDERTITQTRNQLGQEIYTDSQTGQQLPGLPSGAVPEKEYRDKQRTANQEMAKTQPEIGKVFDAAAAGRASLAQLDQLQQDLAKTGTLSGSDLASRLGRYIDQTTGSSIFGNVSDETMAKMGLGSLGWNNTKSAAAGTGPLRVAEISRLSQLAPNINTPGPARDEFIQIMRDAAQRQVQVAKDLRALQQTDPNNKALQSIGNLKGWLDKKNEDYYEQLHDQRQQQGGVLPAPSAPVTGAPQPGRRPMRPLSDFLTGQPADAGVPPTP